jgi:hypothetical protein
MGLSACTMVYFYSAFVRFLYLHEYTSRVNYGDGKYIVSYYKTVVPVSMDTRSKA